MGEKNELDMKDDLIMLGYVESQNRRSAAPPPVKVRNLDHNGHSRAGGTSQVCFPES